MHSGRNAAPRYDNTVAQALRADDVCGGSLSICINPLISFAIALIPILLKQEFDLACLEVQVPVCFVCPLELS